MSSRYTSARPKRAGEAFARAHQAEAVAGSSSSSDPAAERKVQFDVRNPSTLAADAPEEDAVLEADVIGKGRGATKRGAVNIEGYDSDSDNEEFEARANKRNALHKGILEQLDEYAAGSEGKNGVKKETEQDDDEDDDMFAPSKDENGGKKNTQQDDSKKKRKQVSFLDSNAIEGAVSTSKSGGQVHLGSDGSDTDDSDAIDAAMEEQGIDDEVGRGGLKHRAPKLSAFNMKEEEEEGRFDADGNYIRKAADPDAVHDRWLEGVSKKEMRRAAEAHEKREAELRKKRLEDDELITSDLLSALISKLEKGETPLEVLARLGKKQKKKEKPKKVPKWKQKKATTKAAVGGEEAMDVDTSPSAKAAEHGDEEDIEQVRIKAAINAVTEAADKLMDRGYAEIYDTEREMLLREYKKETGEDWVEPATTTTSSASASADRDGNESIGGRQWEFRWTDGRDDGKVQGPYDGAMMKAWKDAGYFGEGVEFRLHGSGEESWSRLPVF